MMEFIFGTFFDPATPAGIKIANCLAASVITVIVPRIPANQIDRAQAALPLPASKSSTTY
jgi:hypothetical protein